MILDIPSRSYLEQKKEIERIYQLIAQGVSSNTAITRVANEIRKKHQCDQAKATSMTKKYKID